MKKQQDNYCRSWKMRIKQCDKCEKKETQKRTIKRYCVMTQFPNYDYFGFDLCEDCEKNFRRNFKRWLK